MHTHSSLTTNLREVYLLPYVHGLLNYSKTNPHFACQLAQTIQTYNWTASSGAIDEKTAPHTTPSSQIDAFAVCSWVLGQLQSHPDFRLTRGLLTSWTEHYEAPKDLVLGVVGMAIIGPTLGIIDSKKKKKRKAQLVFEKNALAKLTAPELAKKSLVLTQRMFAIELKQAGGNVHSLHPDSAAWLLEEALSDVYTNSKENLTTLVQALLAENLSHTVEKDTAGNLLSVVISPSVNDSLVEDSEAEMLHA